LRTLLLLILAFAFAVAAEPDWKTSDLPLVLGGLSIGAPATRVGERLGKPEREIDSDLKLYTSGLLVRTREGRVVNLTAAGHWTLSQGDRELAAIGSPWPAALGAPRWLYKRQDLVVWLYSVPTADLGVIHKNGLVEGFLLSEPGMLGWALEQAGYRQEEPSAPSP